MKRAIIVDDEQAAINKLERMLNDKIEICGTFTDPMGALAFIKESSVDIAFLDIEMPKISGIELADEIMEVQSSINIIFVTAYSEYAVEAFRCHALDYLLKPVEKERLEMALSRISDLSSASPETLHQLKVQCFGKFSITIDGQTLKFRTAKAEELFAYFIDHNGQAVNRNYIMDSFWNDYDGDRALILFNTTLHYLKKAFIQLGVKLNIKHERGSYTLNLSGIDCDAKFFSETISENKDVRASNIEKYEKAMRLYTGDYFGQNDYVWSMQKRITYKEQYAQIVLNVAKFYLNDIKNAEKAINVIIKGLEFTPVNKGLNYMLLNILMIRNEDVALQRYFRLYKKRLNDEFGLEPDHSFNEFMS